MGTAAFRAMLERATIQGSRSSALAPLAWLVGILVTGTVGALKYNAPTWLIAILCGADVVGAAFYLASYVYLLKHDRDALRSERYSLQKLAIEKGLYGDSLVGVLSAASDVKLIESGKAEAERGKP